jgi:hypothetical protein
MTSFIVLTAFAALVSVVAAIFALLSARDSQQSSRTARLNADEITLVNARCDLLQNAFKRIEGRQVKIAALKNHGGEPDSKTDPEGWRLWKNRQLSQSGKGLQP